MASQAFPHGIAAVVFDMDGTLLDTEPLYREAIYLACAELGYQMTDELHSLQVGVPTDGARQIYAHAFGPDFPFDILKTRMHDFMDEIERTREVEEKRGALDMLRFLKARDMPMAVVTSTTRPTAPQRLERAGMLGLLDVVITRSDVGRGKPHPEPFLAAATLLGVAPEACLAIEDSPTGIRAAHAAGMVCVLVPDLVRPTPEVVALCHSVQSDLDSVRAAYFPQTLA